MEKLSLEFLLWLRERGDAEGHRGTGFLISNKMIEQYERDGKKFTGITGLGMRALHDAGLVTANPAVPEKDPTEV